MHVAVLGAGALGSLVAARLATGDATVTLVGRPGRHLDAIEADGLVLERPDGVHQTVPLDATTDHGAVADADLLVLAVKSYDTATALADVASHLDHQQVLTLQNGLGNAETVADFVDPGRVIAGTTSHGATRPQPGHVRHAGVGDTVIGRYFAENDGVVGSIAATFSGAGIETAVTATIRDAVWEKVLINVGINATTALARVPNGHLVRYAEGERLLEAAVTEAVAVATAEGRTVSEDVVDRARTVAKRTSTNRSSMRQDVESGSRTEIAALNGAIVARGADHGIETPVNATLTDLVSLWETTREE